MIHFVESNISNAILESINSKTLPTKRRPSGFRNTKNYINMIYFLCGRLTFSYPRYFT
ncbi:MAG: transposase [Nitrosomonas sp.]|nr:transposase [Nitrosomonas sp.]